MKSLLLATMMTFATSASADKLTLEAITGATPRLVEEFVRCVS